MGDETWCFVCGPETKRHSSEWVGETSPRPKKLKFRRSRVIVFRLSRRSAQRIRTRGKNSKCGILEKTVMDRLQKRIQLVRPAAFCSRDFFLLHDNASTHTTASVCRFLTQKTLQPFIRPVLSRFISARLFPFPQVKNEVKRTPLCGCC